MNFFYILQKIIDIPNCQKSGCSKEHLHFCRSSMRRAEKNLNVAVNGSTHVHSRALAFQMHNIRKMLKV